MNTKIDTRAIKKTTKNSLSNTKATDFHFSPFVRVCFPIWLISGLFSLLRAISSSVSPVCGFSFAFTSGCTRSIWARTWTNTWKQKKAGRYNRDLTEIFLTAVEFSLWINNFTQPKPWHVIIHPCPNPNGDLAKPLLGLAYDWLIVSHRKLWGVIIYWCPKLG